jgi:hypothetical protein
MKILKIKEITDYIEMMSVFYNVNICVHKSHIRGRYELYHNRYLMLQDYTSDFKNILSFLISTSTTGKFEYYTTGNSPYRLSIYNTEYDTNVTFEGSLQNVDKGVHFKTRHKINPSTFHDPKLTYKDLDKFASMFKDFKTIVRKAKIDSILN